MKRTNMMSGMVALIASLCLLTFPGAAFSQLGPMPPQYNPQQTYPPQQYPSQQSGYPSQQGQYPGQQPGYPPPQSQYPPSPPGYPPQQPQAQQAPAQRFNDPFGRFKMELPQGTMPMSSNYSFGIPSAMAQVSIMTMAQDQMFQMNMQNFPNMLRQMGANIDTEQAINVKGKQGRFIAATMKDQMSGTSMHSMNVFIPGPNICLQVMGPEQNMQSLQQTFQTILGGLEF
jgi:hypothetical protein